MSGYQTFLKGEYKSVPQDSSFWFEVHEGLNSFISLPVKIKFEDPEQYGEGVPDGVFEQIIRGIRSKELSPDTFLFALSKFSEKCTEDEWKRWYRPILEKRIRFPFVVSEWNDMCPEEYQIQGFELSKYSFLSEEFTIPQSYTIEPYEEQSPNDRFLWFVDSEGISLKTSYGELVEAPETELLLPLTQQLPEPIVLDSYCRNGLWTFTDFILKRQFDGEAHMTPWHKRYAVLHQMFTVMIEPLGSCFNLIDVMAGELGDNTIRDGIGLLFEQGYTAFAFRDVNSNFTMDRIVVSPSKRNVLTCTDITPFPENSGRNQFAEYIHGTGRASKKKFETPVFFGLDMNFREELLENKDDLIGRKFIVHSCGLGPDDKLLFPVFVDWSKSK